MDALLRAAEEPRRSTEHRVGALLVLTTWADSAALPALGDLLGPPERVLASRFGHVDHSFAPILLEPLTGPVMPSLRAALEPMKAGDPNPEMRTAARALLANLDAMAPSPPGSP